MPGTLVQVKDLSTHATVWNLNLSTPILVQTVIRVATWKNSKGVCKHAVSQIFVLVEVEEMPPRRPPEDVSMTCRDLAISCSRHDMATHILF